MKYEVKNLKHSKGSVFDLDIAKVVLSNGISVDVTYDRKQNNLIVHGWYKLDDNAHKQLREELSRFFADRMRKAS